MASNNLLTAALCIVVCSGFWFIFRDMLALKRRVDLLFEDKMAPHAPIKVDEACQADSGCDAVDGDGDEDEEDDDDAQAPSSTALETPPVPLAQAPAQAPEIFVHVAQVLMPDPASAEESPDSEATHRGVLIEDVTDSDVTVVAAPSSTDAQKCKKRPAKKVA